MLRSFKHIVLQFFVLFSVLTALGQTEDEIKTRANKMFEAENYIGATEDFLHLLSLSPMDHDLNFKYGACLLHNSHNKQGAMRYLNYAVLSPDVDPRAHYFRGRALHLNYEFEEAKKNYKNYQSKRQKSDDRYPVDREIAMCDNGKRLLTTFTDIIVADKKEIDGDKFFRIYSDSKTIGGQILVTEQFQSKMDKKMGHVPIVHFPPNAKAIYYSSYGEDLSSGLDIYVRRKLPDNSWGDPQRLPGAVNTSEDEDFPYMHPSGNFLYFSSTGHNSMGGYDVFMSRLDPETNSFKSPENVDFAISSPDDDYFYVVDSLFQNAYFASARQSTDGKLHVYKVKVARVPIQEVIVMGDFLSEINPENKGVSITLTAHSNGKQVGDIKSNKVGKYSFVFPQGGKYDYAITVDGSADVYKFTVELPFLDEFRPLKQKVVHLNENGIEIVKLVNLFDEEVEGAEALLAEVIRKKSELEINIDKFDVEALERETKQKEILASVGFDNMSMSEVAEQLDELKTVAEDYSEVSDKIESNLDSEIVAKTERIATLAKVEDELLAKVEKTSDPAAKHKLLNEAKRKAEEKENLIQAVESLIALKDVATKEIGMPENEAKQLVSAVKEFKDAKEAGDEDKALKVLTENKEILIKAKDGSPEGLVEKILMESKSAKDQISKLSSRIDDYNREEERLKREINELESLLPTAKKKDVESMKTQLSDKKSELALVQSEIKNTQKKIIDLNVKIASLDNQIASLQNAIDTDQAETVDAADVAESEAYIEEMSNGEGDYNYEEEITKIEDENPELFGREPSNPTVAINKTKTQEERRIESDPTLSDLEKEYQYIENNENAIADANQQLTKIEEQLQGNPQDQKLQDKKNEVESYIAQLEQENEEHKSEAANLKANTPDAALSAEDIVVEINPDYQRNLKIIAESTDKSDREKLEAEVALREEFILKLKEEEAKAEKTLKSNPDDSEMEIRKEMLTELINDANTELSDVQANLAALPADNVATKTFKPSDIISDYDDKVSSIEEDNSLIALERENKLKVEDEALILAIDKEQKKVEKQLKKNPEDADALAEKKALEELKDVTQSNIDERTQTIAALNQNENNDTVVPTTNNAFTEQEVIATIIPDYEKQKEGLKKEAKKSKKGLISLLDLETSLMDGLEAKQEQLESQLSSDQDNKQLKDELAIVEQAIIKQRLTISELQDELIAQMDTEEKNSVISGVDPSYASDSESLVNNDGTVDEQIDREVELQIAINAKINELEEQQRRKFSVRVEYEKKQLEEVLKESQNRENSLRQSDAVTPETNPVAQKNYIDEIRGDNAVRLDDEFFELDDLKTQEENLIAYEEKLASLIAATEKKIKKSPSEELTNELKWLEEEQITVQEKRRKVSIKIGELETNVATNENGNESNNDQREKLAEEQAQIEEALNNPNLSKSERKELDQKLEDNLTAQTKAENKELQESINREEQETNDIKEHLRASEENSPLATAVVDKIDREEAELKLLEDKAEKAKTEEERNFILREIDERRNELNNEAAEVETSIKIKEIEEQEDVKLTSKEELEQKKRKFTVRIGEISNEIVAKDKEISDAKKKEIPGLEAEKNNLEEERSMLIKQLQAVEEALLESEKQAPVVNPLAMEEQISFNEERKIASTEAYADYENLASEALEVENQIRNLEDELKEEKKAINHLIESRGGNEDEIALRVERVKEIEQEIDRLNVELIQMKYAADKALPADPEESMRMQNLVARGVKPIKTTLVAAAILQLPSNGFAIDTESNSVYSESNPIPVDVEGPSGLVYRVQVGAFAKPIPQDLFKEFNPVSGEKIDGTNITRYMAGFFNSSNDVVDARGKIRDLGYSDAFVVAYCDGERISFGEARRREAEGTCVPKGTNELMLDVATKTAEKLGLPATSEVVELPEYDYAKAPGAVEADPIENMKGLFFTVQIGVFNRPVGPEYLHGMTEVISLRLPNGQIRYSSGRFDSVEDALPRRNLALSNGVVGAFVTAYFEGERISLSEAKRILETRGRGILQSEMDKNVVKSDPVVDNVIQPIRTDSVSIEKTDVIAISEVNPSRVQVVTKKTFDEFPRDVLNRYNAEGSFYYDKEDKRVKSIVYKNEDYLPRLYNFIDDIDTVYIPAGLMADEEGKIIEILFSDSIIPGDFMDRMLRFNYRKEFKSTERGIEFRIYGVKEQIIEGILNELREFGVSPVVKEETEFELELNENH